jgi:hypothetical protein
MLAGCRPQESYRVMRQFKLDIAETMPCTKCGEAGPVGVHNCNACGTGNATIGFDEFFDEVQRGQIVNAQKGGLVIGRDDAHDDIPMFAFAGHGIFRLIGMMQGGEYVLSVEAATEHRVRLEAINAEKGPYMPPTSVAVTPHTSIINVNLCPPTAALWFAAHGQFIVNRFATAKYLAELESLNSCRLSA